MIMQYDGVKKIVDGNNNEMLSSDVHAKRLEIMKEQHQRMVVSLILQKDVNGAEMMR